MEMIDTEETQVLKSLTALAQVHRLRVFRLLVVAGKAGLTAGGIAEKLGISPSALSFHLKELLYTCLVTNESRGRNVVYRANFEHMNSLVAYLSEHCCEGQSCELTEFVPCTESSL
ncbi:MAG: ArsR/SmtB family transcription factor [Burkholderiaceae bacterium]